MGLGHSKCSIYSGASLVAQTVKNLPAMQETWVQSLGQGDPLEKGMATHSSILAWKMPWTEEPGGLRSIALQRVGHDWEHIQLILFLFDCYEHMIVCCFFLLDKWAYIQGTWGLHLNLVCWGCPQAPANSALLLIEGLGLEGTSPEPCLLPWAQVNSELLPVPFLAVSGSGILLSMPQN